MIQKKPINKAKKGQKKEKEARDELTKAGWRVVFKSIRFRFGCVDYANLFDVVAYKGKDRKFISCKHFGNSNYYLPHQQEIKDFKEKYGYPGESYELWIWQSARWKGRGENKKWYNGVFIKLVL